MSDISNFSLKNTMDSIVNLKEDFISYMILAFILIILIIFIIYSIYISRLENSECNFMTNLYGSLDGKIRSINPNDSDYNGSLFDYYINTAYNACSGGSYKNDFVSLCNLKNILKQGVRCLDFEIYSINNQPVVSTSTIDNVFVKETYNYVPFTDVMNIIQNYAYSSSTAPNFNDPIIIHLRFMSNNQEMYNNLANIFKSYESRMLGKEYSYENYGKNIGSTSLIKLMNKIVLIVDKSNTTFLENKKLLEYVNLTSNSFFMRAYNYYDVKNNPDLNELREYNKSCMTIVFPDKGTNPNNPSGIFCRDAGCQMVAMRYQYIDNFFEENNTFFDNCGHAFCLKPENLRFKPVTIAKPTPQNPALSYATRNVQTDYYNFKY
jgi:hypothetical protein